MYPFKKSLFVATLLSVPLAGCGPLISFGEEGPPDTVYSLRYQGGYAAENTDGPVVFVDEPTLAEGLHGDKVSVVLDESRRMTLDGVRWAAPVSDLVRNYVTRALGHKSSAQVIGAGGLDISTACRLGIKVWALEYSPGTDASADKVDIAMEFALVRLGDSKLVSKPTITKTVPVDGRGDDAVIAAFNTAMAAIARDMSQWFVEKLPTCEVTP